MGLLLLIALETMGKHPGVSGNMSCHVFLFSLSYCFWPSDCYYRVWLMYSRHTSAFRGLDWPLALDLYLFLDDSGWEDIIVPLKVQHSRTKTCVWLKVHITCQDGLYIKLGKRGGKRKPICPVSFISFKCYCNTQTESKSSAMTNILPSFLSKKTQPLSLH